MKERSKNFMEEMRECVPLFSSEEVAWDKMERLFAPVGYGAMKETPQNPVYHGEGDVYTHMRLVCRELVKNPEFHKLPPERGMELFLAAVLHDIGKTKTTRRENGAWVSPGHAAAGSRIVRRFLWRDCGLGGTLETMAFRETICALIRYHMQPLHLLEREEPERRVWETACIGELASGFTWELLYQLAEADVKGRIAGDVPEILERVQLSRILAEEEGCLYAPHSFPNAFTKRACLSGRNVRPEQTLYDASWGEAIMLSGLPGTGKDTWIGENLPDLPIVSLDEIRRKRGIKPTENQGSVIWEAQEEAKEYLRKKQPFVWNATNVARDTRRKLTGLFERYGARVRIVYLETEWEKRMERNLGRLDAVPEAAVEKMLERMVPPMPDEAQTVEWVCI